MEIDYKNFSLNENILFCVTSLDGEFLYVNDSWKTMLNYNKEDLMKHSFKEFVHKDDVESSTKQLPIIHENKSLFNFENRYYIKGTAQIKWILWNATLKKDSPHIYATGTDITEKKFNAQNTSILLSRINHEIRNPLNSIINYSKLLEPFSTIKNSNKDKKSDNCDDE